MPLVPALRRPRQAGFKASLVYRESEFQDSHGYVETFCLKQDNITKEMRRGGDMEAEADG